MNIKKYYCLFVCLLCSYFLKAQAIIEHGDCGSGNPATRVYPNKALVNLRSVQATFPLLMKVFVHVVRQNGVPVVADTTMMRQLLNMKEFYSPQNICFILAGYEEITDATLIDVNASTDEGLLSPYLIPNMINVFVHNSLFDNSGSLNGVAYHIPGYYLSVASNAETSASNRSTLAHEMGHCFGLYHTFQSRNDGTDIIREHVARSGSCMNCDSEGDLLCDTKADRNTNDSTENIINCVYTGNWLDGCGVRIPMEPTNLMTYGDRSCRFALTNGQGARARDFILSTDSLTNAIAPDSYTQFLNYSISSGRSFFITRNSVDIIAPSFVVTGAARVNMNSSSVRLFPGVSLTPAGTGYTWIRANNLCQ